MKVKSLVYILVLFVTLFTISCSKGKTPHNISKNILHKIIYYTHNETKLIDFRKNFHPKKYLLRGWAKPERNYTWSNGKKNELFFYSYEKKQPLLLRIICKSIPLVENSTQKMAVTVNGHKLLKPLLISPSEFKEYSIEIPAKFLSTGYNLLHFATSVTSAPRKLFPDFPNNIPIAVAFKKILFIHPANIFLSQSTLSQAGSSELSVYLRLPKSFELSIHYLSQPPISASLTIKQEHGNTLTINLPANKREYHQSINTDGGVSQIVLKTDGDSKRHISWEGITASYKAPPQESLAIHKIKKKAKPDILFYVVDTLRSDHLHCYGYARGTSPNIDQFAKENSLFLNAYSNDSWTRPSAATILTGLYPKHHKTTHRDDKLPSDVVTIAEYLKDQGYFTAGFIANGNLSHVFGFDQGFDVFQEHFNLEENNPLKQVVLSGQINKNTFKFLDQYITRKQRKPLFLLVWTVDPHEPYAPPNSVKKMFDINKYEPIDTYVTNLVYKLRVGTIKPTPSQLLYIKTRYDQEIFFNDASFGALIDKYKKLNLYRNSLIVFTGDHGEEFEDHKGAGHGRTLYNELVKIPLIIKSPQIPQGVHTELVQHMDIFPTTLAALGTDKVVPYHIDGMNISKIRGQKRTLFLEEDLDRNKVWAVIDDTKKLIFNQRVNRSAIGNNVPYFESFSINDINEKKPMVLEGTEDQFRLQELLAYKGKIGSSINLNVKQEEATIPIKLDNKLKELGYIK